MRATLLAFIASPLLLLPACKVDSQGETGQLRFAFVDPDQLFTESFDSPIAAGTRARIQVKGKDRQLADRIQAARVTPASVADIDLVEEKSLWVAAHAPGEATLRVKADDVEDRITVRVAAADQVRLEALNSATLAFSGGTEPLAVRRSAGDCPLVGEARLEDVVIEPAGAAERVDGPDARVTVRYGAPGTVTVAAPDGFVRRIIVPLDAAARLKLYPSPEGGQAVTLNSSAVVGLRAFDANDAQIAGLGGVVQITAHDPSVCDVTLGDYLGFEGFAVNPRGEGDCVLTVTLAGLEETLTYPVVPAEDD